MICFSAFVTLFLLLLLYYEVLDGEGLWLGYCSARQYEETDIDDPSAPQKKVDSFNEVLRSVVDWLISQVVPPLRLYVSSHRCSYGHCLLKFFSFQKCPRL
jgi:hypothetical protein